jgi:phosphoribosyl 1,2-cyclic phosphate phosphodiesterase
VRVTVLGCGTSTGVPVIGCRCPVCTSEAPENRRLRTGLRLEAGGRTVLVDTPTDLRQQALAFGVDRVDAVVYTHAHADHTHGIDELRTFNFRQGGPIPCYGNHEAVTRIRQSFGYIFEEGEEGGGKPRIVLHEVAGPFRAAGIELVPVPAWHGELEVYGYRAGRFAYLTDCNRIPEESFERLAGVELLILDGLRFEPPHPTHFTVAEASAAAARIGARRTWLTHLTHDVDYHNPKYPLPDGVELAYDGLQFAID